MAQKAPHAACLHGAGEVATLKKRASQAVRRTLLRQRALPQRRRISECRPAARRQRRRLCVAPPPRQRLPRWSPRLSLSPRPPPPPRHGLRTDLLVVAPSIAAGVLRSRKPAAAGHRWEIEACQAWHSRRGGDSDLNHCPGRPHIRPSPRRWHRSGTTTTADGGPEAS